ncbi:phage tail terminator family protein [Clostridium botulinum]|uniref:phage tail terminator family protein n=1 Tax=Clostridium botulinum TaxID=1491 RepID=UPI0019680838|nr:hypothetical protein [Clostridium botulinum]MBN1059341.1 hypothetical protein [Clostridium botulinum]
MNYKIKYVDLLYSVYASLKSSFKDSNVILNESKSEVQGPLFFVQIKALDSDSYRHYTKEFVNVTITYTDLFLDQEKILEVQDELNELFDDGIRVEGTFIYFDKKRFSEGENCIVLTLTLKYHNSKNLKNIQDSDKYTKMIEELHMKINNSEEEIK